MDIGEGLANFGSSIGGALEKRAKLKKEFERSSKIADLLKDKYPDISNYLKSGLTIDEALTMVKSQPSPLEQAATKWMGEQGGLPGAAGGALPNAVQGSPQGATPQLKGFKVGGMEFEVPKRDVQAEKFDVEQADKLKEQEAKSQFVKDSTNDTLNTIKAVKDGINYFGAGSLIPAIPTLQPEKVKWQANLNKLLSGKVIKLMTDMKSASKTGATGFGQLSEKELKVLQDASTALKGTLSPKDAKKYLDDMENSLQKIIPDNQSIPKKGDVVDGYTFIGGDPGDPKSWSKQ
jgi:hypothetical protein